MAAPATARHGQGLVIFAVVLLVVAGLFNLLHGIVAIADASFYVGSQRFVIGDLRAWGWTVTIIGGLQVLAGLGVWRGSQVARWAGVALCGLGALAQMFYLPVYPVWSLIILAAEALAIWGLCAYA